METVELDERSVLMIMAATLSAASADISAASAASQAIDIRDAIDAKLDEQSKWVEEFRAKKREEAKKAQEAVDAENAAADEAFAKIPARWLWVLLYENRGHEYGRGIPGVTPSVLRADHTSVILDANQRQSIRLWTFKGHEVIYCNGADADFAAELARLVAAKKAQSDAEAAARYQATVEQDAKIQAEKTEAETAIVATVRDALAALTAPTDPEQ